MPLEVHKVAQSDKVGIFRTVERSRKLGVQFAIFVIDEKLDLHGTENLYPVTIS